MTPAQLAVLIAQHNALHSGEHARTTQPTADPSELYQLAAMRRVG